jgi:hypothetical protein
LLGEGILKGMAETARNFFGSYFSADRMTTVEYPEQRIAAYEAARVFPLLVYDSKNPEVHLYREVNRQEAGRSRQAAVLSDAL